jgi:hypothetical protein
MRVAAQQAIEPISRAVERRLLDERVINWAIFKLPWRATDYDKARVRRECAEILAEQPQDISEVEAQEALEPTVQEARLDIEKREAEAQPASLKQTAKPASHFRSRPLATVSRK